MPVALGHKNNMYRALAAHLADTLNYLLAVGFQLLHPHLFQLRQLQAFWRLVSYGFHPCCWDCVGTFSCPGSACSDACHSLATPSCHRHRAQGTGFCIKPGDSRGPRAHQRLRLARSLPRPRDCSQLPGPMRSQMHLQPHLQRHPRLGSISGRSCHFVQHCHTAARAN